METIAKVWHKCKGEWFAGLVLILVALLAFGLGRWSKLSPIKTPIRMVESVNDSFDKTIVQVVGSKQGSKYHLPGCAGAKSIKPENLVTFSSVEKAKAAGYEPAANCPGLN